MISSELLYSVTADPTTTLLIIRLWLRSSAKPRIIQNPMNHHDSVCIMTSASQIYRPETVNRSNTLYDRMDNLESTGTGPANSRNSKLNADKNHIEAAIFTPRRLSFQKKTSSLNATITNLRTLRGSTRKTCTKSLAKVCQL